MKKKITINKVKSFGTCAKIVAAFFALVLICNVSTAQPWLQVNFYNDNDQPVTIDWPGHSLGLEKGYNYLTASTCDDIEYDVYYKDASGHSTKIFWVTYKRGNFSDQGDIDFFCDEAWASAITVYDNENKFAWGGSDHIYCNSLDPGNYLFNVNIENQQQ